MHAGAGQARTTELAGAIRDQERGDHAIPFFEGAHLGPDLLDDSHPLVPHALSRFPLIDATIGPQIRATNPRMRNPSNHIGWSRNAGIGNLVDAHICGSMIHGCSHMFLLFLFSTLFFLHERENAHSLLSRLVLFVDDLLHPVGGFAVKSFLNGNMRHGRSWRGTVPMFLARREPDHIPWPNFLNRPSPALDPATASSHDQGLTQG